MEPSQLSYSWWGQEGTTVSGAPPARVVQLLCSPRQSASWCGSGTLILQHTASLHEATRRPFLEPRPLYSEASSGARRGDAALGRTTFEGFWGIGVALLLRAQRGTDTEGAHRPRWVGGRKPSRSAVECLVRRTTRTPSTSWPLTKGHLPDRPNWVVLTAAPLPSCFERKQASLEVLLRERALLQSCLSLLIGWSSLLAVCEHTWLVGALTRYSLSFV